MTATSLTVSHPHERDFRYRLPAFIQYRDLSIKDATGGRVVAHIVPAAPGVGFSGQPRRHLRVAAS